MAATYRAPSLQGNTFYQVTGERVIASQFQRVISKPTCKLAVDPQVSVLTIHRSDKRTNYNALFPRLP